MLSLSNLTLLTPSLIEDCYHLGIRDVEGLYYSIVVAPEIFEPYLNEYGPGISLDLLVKEIESLLPKETALAIGAIKHED
jgi:hypothetical protein